MYFNPRAGLLRLLVTLALCIAAFVVPAYATSFSTDNSDVQAAQNEDGWALQMVQRADVIFVTMYVYDAQNDPIFYTATLTFAGTNAAGAAIWIGDLYVTRGPWFGAPTFNSAQVTYRPVGRMTYVASFVESSSLTYTVDGVSVSKYDHPPEYGQGHRVK